MRKPLMVGLRGLALAVIVTTASAQGDSGTPSGMMGPGMMGGQMTGPNAMGPGMMGSGMMTGNGQMASMCAMMTSHMDGRLAFVRAELKITKTQEPLWNAYASAARDSAQTMAARCTSMMSQGGSTALNLPDRLDRHEQFMVAQLDALRASNKMLKPLYAAFSDSQKQTANQLFWGPMGMM